MARLALARHDLVSLVYLLLAPWINASHWLSTGKGREGIPFTRKKGKKLMRKIITIYVMVDFIHVTERMKVYMDCTNRFISHSPPGSRGRKTEPHYFTRHLEAPVTLHFLCIFSQKYIGRHLQSSKVNSIETRAKRDENEALYDHLTFLYRGSERIFSYISDA